MFGHVAGALGARQCIGVHASGLVSELQELWGSGKRPPPLAARCAFKPNRLPFNRNERS
jgi:hypothetical protein